MSVALALAVALGLGAAVAAGRRRRRRRARSDAGRAATIEEAIARMQRAREEIRARSDAPIVRADYHVVHRPPDADDRDELAAYGLEASSAPFLVAPEELLPRRDSLIAPHGDRPPGRIRYRAIREALRAQRPWMPAGILRWNDPQGLAARELARIMETYWIPDLETRGAIADPLLIELGTGARILRALGNLVLDLSVAESLAQGRRAMRQFEGRIDTALERLKYAPTLEGAMAFMSEALLAGVEAFLATPFGGPGEARTRDIDLELERAPGVPLRPMDVERYGQAMWIAYGIVQHGGLERVVHGA